MKVVNISLKIYLILILTLFFINLVRAAGVPVLIPSKNAPLVSQTGNFSDATGPALIEGASSSQIPYLSSLSQSNFEAGLSTADSVNQAVQLFEQFRATEWAQYFRKKILGKVPSVEQISQTLFNLAQKTGNKSALIYVASLAKEVQMIYILPTAINAEKREKVLKESLNNSAFQLKNAEANRAAILKALIDWREEISLPTNSSGPGSLREAQQLYQWLIQPLEPALTAKQINTLAFSMDAGLRSLPIAALHDGKQFLIEKYSVVLIPSFGLTDTRYVDVRNQKILAMGAAEFKDFNQPPLPAVPVEISTILRPPWKGISFLNEDFTLDKLLSVYRQQRFGIIHLATHAQFNPGDASQSFIQFGNSQLRLDRVSEVAEKLGWPKPPPVEMLVLSACETALGNEPELGFAGIAIQAGVKTALASLWRVDDIGTLALMSEFYLQLSQTPIKAEALRQAQLAMLRKQVRIENGQLWLSQGEPIALPPNIADREIVYFSHPHYWAGFTLIGNWN